MPGGNRKTYILKQTCNFGYRFVLSMYGLLLPPDIKGLTS